MLYDDKSKNVVGNEVKVWVTVTHLCIFVYDIIWKSFHPFKENLSIYMSWNFYIYLWFRYDLLHLTYSLLHLQISAIIILVRIKVLVTLSNREQVIKIEVDKCHGMIKYNVNWIISESRSEKMQLLFSM